MIDLDNFKYINDYFGHSSGDKVLKYVSKSIAESADGFGLVGRFGGDELLLIDLKNIEQDQKKSFFEELYTGSKALRVTIDFPDGASLITATSGCATYPKDAGNFDNIFNLIDKMLYLGKGRGRDCYTIYSEDKHKNIEIQQLAKRGIFNEMQSLNLRLNGIKGFENKLKAATTQLAEVLQIKDLYYVKDDGRLRAVMDPGFDGDARDIDSFMNEDVYAERTLDKVKKEAPVFYGTLKDNRLNSALIMRCGQASYLVCAVERNYRIWQENECAILYYLAGLLD